MIRDSEKMRLYKQGLDDKEIAKRLGCTREAVRAWRKRNDLASANKWESKLHADHAKRLELYNQGKTDKEIAAALESSETTIWHWRKTNNLPPVSTVNARPKITKVCSCGNMFKTSSRKRTQCQDCRRRSDLGVTRAEWVAKAVKEEQEIVASSKRLKPGMNTKAIIRAEKAARKDGLTYGQANAPKVEVNIPAWARAKRCI